MKIARLFGSLLSRHELENLKAETAQNAADIEYIAMMTDVELEAENEEENENVQ